ncbi:MAG: two-component system OmpR family sensor kinase, partial [Planctomycetota bacterium]
LFQEARFRLQREINRAERVGVEFDIEVEGDGLMRGDREAMLAAVRNFVSNALDWTKKGGRVRLLLDGRGTEIQVAVDDDGPGVPQELHESLFEPFVRGPAAAGRRIGYGLGLALARSAAVAQDGSISVGSSDLGGARFTLRFPRERPNSG